MSTLIHTRPICIGVPCAFDLICQLLLEQIITCIFTYFEHTSKSIGIVVIRTHEVYSEQVHTASRTPMIQTWYCVYATTFGKLSRQRITEHSQSRQALKGTRRDWTFSVLVSLTS
jgi:hypothetical protein